MTSPVSHSLELLSWAPLFSIHSLPPSRAPVMSSTLLYTLIVTLSSSCHKLHSSLLTRCHSRGLLSRAPLFSTQLPHSLALSLLMYNYVRVILILYKPLGEEDKFLTLCFRPLNPKYLLRVHYLPRLYSLTSRLLPRTDLSPHSTSLLRTLSLAGASCPCTPFLSLSTHCLSHVACHFSTHHPLHIAHCMSPIAHCLSPVTFHSSPIACSQSPIVHYFLGQSRACIFYYRCSSLVSTYRYNIHAFS
jgi:hypothetical protein